ncbi:MAG: hypothetical protein JWR63_3201, partial [Conexibacter sp.]|nr:hypothetical protein [Conexibacter sp.]
MCRSNASTRTAAAVLGTLALALSALGSCAPGAAIAQRTQPDAQELWRAYPLDGRAANGRQPQLKLPAGSQAPPAQRRPEAASGGCGGGSGGGGSGAALPIVIAVACAALLCGVLLGRRRRGATTVPTATPSPPAHAAVPSTLARPEPASVGTVPLTAEPPPDGEPGEAESAPP